MLCWVLSIRPKFWCEISKISCDEWNSIFRKFCGWLHQPAWWTFFPENFPVASNRSVQFRTEISRTFGRMENANYCLEQAIDASKDLVYQKK